MFLRKNRKRFEGEVYEYWTLFETIRTERGPRQRVVASLGKLTDDDLAAGWDDLEALLDGRKPAPKQRCLGETPGTEADGLRWELADLSRLGVGWGRAFGSVFLALALWRWLGLHELLSDLIEPGREEIAWAVVGNHDLGSRGGPCPDRPTLVEVPRGAGVSGFLRGLRARPKMVQLLLIACAQKVDSSPERSHFQSVRKRSSRQRAISSVKTL